VCPSIRKDGSPEVRTSFEYEKHAVRKLEDLKWKGGLVEPRYSGRQAARFGVVLLQIGQALFVELPGPRLEWNIDYLLHCSSIGFAGAYSGNVLDSARVP
jgi:hypothetical protein